MKHIIRGENLLISRVNIQFLENYGTWLLLFSTRSQHNMFGDKFYNGISPISLWVKLLHSRVILNSTAWWIQHHVYSCRSVFWIENLPSLIFQMKIKEHLVSYKIKEGAYNLQRCDHFSCSAKKLNDVWTCKHVKRRHYLWRWTNILIIISIFCCHSVLFIGTNAPKNDLIVKLLLRWANVILVL